MAVVITIPKPPSTNNLFIGSGKRRIRSPRYREWAELAGWEITHQRPPKTLGPVSLMLEIQEPTTKHRQDLDNKTKAPLDLLVSLGLIEADDQRIVREIKLKWSPEVEGARITITPFQRGAQ